MITLAKIKAAVAVWLACHAWDVQPPEKCVNELLECFDKIEDVEKCQSQILDRYEPK